MKHATSLTTAPLVIVTLTALSVIATFFVPTPADVTNTVAAHWRAAASIAPAFLLVGSAAIFLRGLNSFKAGRAAYRLIAIGMLVFSLLLIQVAIWGLFDMWDSLWATSGTGLLPFAVTALFIYIAARSFARQYHVSSVLANLWFVVGATLAVALGMGIFANYFVAYDIAGTAFYIGTCTWGAISLTFAALLIYRVSRAIGSAYRLAMQWLAVSLAAFSAACWHESITTLWFNNGSTYTDYGYYLIPWTITGLFTLYASYRFRQITRFVQSDEVPEHPAADSDYLDSVMTVAGLASRPEEIDPLLDDLRSLTATMQPGQPLTSTQKQQLITIYHKLALYLQNDEPLRTVTQEELLSRVTPPFRQLVKAQPQQPADNQNA